MSSQSGITVSSELVDAFKSMTNNALVVKISSDFTQLIPDTSYQSKSKSLKDEFEALNQHISKSHPDPAYILIPKSEQEHIFISFIPDIAPIKQKMLYASTKNTLISSLGGNFSKHNTHAWTDLDELNHESYQAETNNVDGPLSVDEQVLKQINEMQDLSLGQGFKRQLASMHDNSSKSSLSLAKSSNLLVNIDDDLQDLFNDLGNNSDSNSLITFNIDQEVLKLNDSVNKVLLKDLISTLQSSNTANSPQYGIYKYSPKKHAFIYSCPSGSKVKDRMIHASTKVGLINHLNGLLNSKNLKIDKSLEVGDLNELDLSELQAEEETGNNSSDTNTTGLRFSKPKGPRRR